MNVPGLTATSVEAIPADVPYIFPDPELVERWRRELAGTPGLKVGINWQGNPKYAGDRHRSIPLATYEPLRTCRACGCSASRKTRGWISLMH